MKEKNEQKKNTITIRQRLDKCTANTVQRYRWHQHQNQNNVNMSDRA